MVQCPGGLAQWAQTQPMPMPHMPQMAPPLCQPLPEQPAGGTTAKEVYREGSCFQPPTDETTPMGGTCSQGHGRPATRGWGDGGRSISCPRGMQGKVSAQPLHQVGNLPSGSMPLVPPPAAPEGTQTQHGGRPRSTLHDPA